MTDLVHHQPQQVPALADLSPASAIIRQTAQDLADAHKIASALVHTAFAPAHFRGKPEEGAAAILYGATIDMDPLTALQNLYVIGGKPALYARAMVAVVMSHGHRIWTEDETDGAVTVAGQRKGTNTIERVTWTTQMAQRAGYTSNKKYQTDPRSMLYARASGDVARRIAPDALLGMAHNVEELTLDPTADSVEQPPAPRRVTAADFTTPTAAPSAASPADPPPVDVTDAEVLPDEPKITQSQTRKMAALMREDGLTNRDEAIAWVSTLIGRQIGSRNELTKAEASTVIDTLEQQKTDKAPSAPTEGTDGDYAEPPADFWAQQDGGEQA